MAFNKKILSLILILISAQAFCIIHFDVNLKKMVRDHETIVIAEITNKHSFWQNKRIMTQYDLSIKQTLKGSKEKNISLLGLGGIINNIKQEIVGNQELILDSEYLLFISNTKLMEKKVTSIPALSLGMFLIENNNQKKIATNQAQPSASPQAINGKQYELSELITQIKQHLK